MGYLRGWAAWGGLGLVVLYTLGQWREIVAYFRQRHARYGAIATVGVIVALAIAVAVNYLAARQNKRWDFTANRQNSLAEQTVKVCRASTRRSSSPSSTSRPSSSDSAAASRRTPTRHRRSRSSTSTPT